MKRIVLVFDGNKLTAAPDFCEHQNANVCYNEADGTLYHCPDCGSLLDENLEILPVPDLEEIF